MTTTLSSANDAATKYDNNGQYSRNGILRYEKIFGPGYISTGGQETTDALIARLVDRLTPGARVLDVGSGIGGAAFDLAKRFGVKVVGVDLAPEMIAIAHERALEANVGDSVEFHIADIMTTTFDEPFDIVWSRDALMHIHDKPALFQRLYSLLKPGGRLVVTDYARGTGVGSAGYQAYIAKTGYHVIDPATYGKLLEAAGFVDVVAEDATDQFIAIMHREAEQLKATRAEFVQMFSEEDASYLIERWAMKDVFCKAGDQKWGIYKADKR